MSRARSPNRNAAKKMYLKSNGTMKLKDIATELGVSDSQIRKWKNQDKWDTDLKVTLPNKTKSNVTKNKKGAQPGNKNSKGGPLKNKKAETHGFFSKYLPEDTFEVIKEIEQKDPLDILWENINIQYAAIIRAQKIMHVKSQKDLTKELKREKESNGDTSDSWEKEYELQFAWDKQATFLEAQSRAMKTLEGMIKQYDELLKSSLATEEQKARIEVLKSKVPSKDTANIQGQINALADLIKHPQEREQLENE